MSEKFAVENEDHFKLIKYCKEHFRQNTTFPKSFIDASYDELVKFLEHQGKNIENVFLEIFLEETPDPLRSG